MSLIDYSAMLSLYVQDAREKKRLILIDSTRRFLDAFARSAAENQKRWMMLDWFLSFCPDLNETAVRFGLPYYL